MHLKSSRACMPFLSSASVFVISIQENRHLPHEIHKQDAKQSKLPPTPHLPSRNLIRFWVLGWSNNVVVWSGKTRPFPFFSQASWKMHIMSQMAYPRQEGLEFLKLLSSLLESPYRKPTFLWNTSDYREMPWTQICFHFKGTGTKGPFEM